MQQFQVRKDNFVQSRLVESATDDADPAIGPGQVLARIDRFGFSANNVTYAVAGDRIGYWQFFPPAGDDTDGWGVVPVWGFADVVATNASEVPVGDRLFGYFPPATHLVLTPAKVSENRLVDAAPHRAKLPPAYNNYQRVLSEPGYERAADDERMLLWPLYITSFCLWDALREYGWYGAKQLVILSASSKTSLGLGYAVAADAASPPAIAVTSARHLDFVTKLGLYAKAVTYDALSAIDTGVATVIVDMSGNRRVLGQLHTLLGDNMKRCVNVGLTHWDNTETGHGIIRERSEFFFAPGHIQKRVSDWGPEGFAARSSAFMRKAAKQSRDWLKMSRVDGLRGLAEIYPEVCAGHIAADRGLIIEL